MRLRALELIEERGERGGGQNVFRRALEEMEGALNMEEIEKNAEHPDKGKAVAGDAGETKAGAGSGEAKAAGDENTVLDLTLVKTNPDKLYPLIYYALKKVLKEWEQSMAERPGMCFRCVAHCLVY